MKMPSQISPEMLAPCGVNCLLCSAHLAAKNPCPGCRAPEETITRRSCRACQIKQCAASRGLTWCWECGEFPCKLLRPLIRRYRTGYGVDLLLLGKQAKEDLLSVLNEQRLRYICPSCGGIVDLHARSCSECGRTEDK